MTSSDAHTSTVNAKLQPSIAQHSAILLRHGLALAMFLLLWLFVLVLPGKELALGLLILVWFILQQSRQEQSSEHSAPVIQSARDRQHIRRSTDGCLTDVKMLIRAACCWYTDSSVKGCSYMLVYFVGIATDNT